MAPENDPARAAKRAVVEDMLARYPHIDAAQVDELSAYFRSEASAFDIAALASNPEVHDQYRSFRAEHIDPFRPGDWVRAGLFALAVAAIILAIMWRAL